jgi:4-alpha-glucanotransferase
VSLGRALCGELAEAERREWWLSNGRGAYASGTVAGALTRRYHGLLTAPLTPPLGRRLVLVKADATLLADGDEWPLFTNRWSGGAVEPAGHVHIDGFRLEGRMPVWRFAVGDLAVEQRIWMPHGEDATCVAFRLVAGYRDGPLRLRLGLLVNDRDHHCLTSVGSIDPPTETLEDCFRVALSGGACLRLVAVGGHVIADRAWIEGFDLPVERERGLDDRDNHLRVGFAELDLRSDRWCGLLASLAPGAQASWRLRPPSPALPRQGGGGTRTVVAHPCSMAASARPDLAASMADSRRRNECLLAKAVGANPGLATAPGWVRQLLLAADGFLFERPLANGSSGLSVIAGYPWFGDWGRDTMIALPGLTLVTGRFAEAREILTTFARWVDGGLLANHFPGAGEAPAYNTVDAALWYIEAWRAYLEATGDLPSAAQVFPVLTDIVAHYRDGTRFGTRMDPRDGLIRAGEPGVQLTWMDAKVADWVVTPRIGKPVEINALWYNALRSMADLAGHLGPDGEEFGALAARVRAGFERYCRGIGEGLYDVLDGPRGDDRAIRPNQILAVSLPHSPLDVETRAAVVAECGRHLLCSHGLRSLAPGHPDYRGAYTGDLWARDGAYHQGTAWAWLLGHYALAEYRVSGDAALALSRLEPIAEHLSDAGLGNVSEIFDADPPHRPRGAPAQAWSVACILEAWWRISRDRPTPTGAVPNSA